VPSKQYWQFNIKNDAKQSPAKRERKQEKSTDKQTDLMCFLGHKKLQKNEFWHQQNLLTDLPKKSTDQQTDR